jgi:hypothetical protein
LLDKEDSFELGLYPLKEVNVVIKKMFIKKVYLMTGIYAWSLQEYAVGDLDENEQATVNLVRINEFGEEEGNLFAYVYGNQTMQNASEYKNLELAPGNYSVNINLLKFYRDGQSLTIATSERKVAIPFKKDEHYTLPEIKFNDAVAAGCLNFDTEQTYLQVKASALYNSQKLVFYVVAPDLTQMTLHEDLEQLGKCGDYSIIHRGTLEPKWED